MISLRPTAALLVFSASVLAQTVTDPQPIFVSFNMGQSPIWSVCAPNVFNAIQRQVPSEMSKLLNSHVDYRPFDPEPGRFPRIEALVYYYDHDYILKVQLMLEPDRPVWQRTRNWIDRKETINCDTQWIYDRTVSRLDSIFNDEALMQKLELEMQSIPLGHTLRESQFQGYPSPVYRILPLAWQYGRNIAFSGFAVTYRSAQQNLTQQQTVQAKGAGRCVQYSDQNKNKDGLLIQQDLNGSMTAKGGHWNPYEVRLVNRMRNPEPPLPCGDIVQFKQAD
jgi:hypothetical protein